MAFYKTLLHEDSPINDLKAHFAPIYDEGQLISVRNFPCIKKGCSNEKPYVKKKKNVKEIYTARVILLHSDLRHKFDIPVQLSNSKEFPFAICPNHLDQNIFNQIDLTGKLPNSYPNSAIVSKKPTIKTKSIKTLLQFSRILKVLCDNPESLQFPEDLPNYNPIYDLFSIPILPSSPEPSGSEHCSSKIQTLNDQNPLSTQPSQSTSHTSEVPTESPTFFYFQEEEPPVIVFSFEETNNIIDVLSNIENSSEYQSIVNDSIVFSYFDCEENIKAATCKSELDLILLPIFYSKVNNDQNLSNLFNSTNLQEVCGTFGNCRIPTTQPYNIITKSKFSSSLLLEAELFQKSNNSLLYLPLSIGLENEYVFRLFPLKSSRLSIEKIVQKLLFTEAQSSFIIAEVIKALDYLHSQDIIFNSLHPKNVFIINKNVKIGDFSNSCKENCAPFGSCNLPFPYKSPELVQEIPFYCNSDIWSLGILFTFLLTNDSKCFFSSQSLDSLQVTKTVTLTTRAQYQFSLIKFSFISLCLTLNCNCRPTIRYFEEHPALNDKEWF